MRKYDREPPRKTNFTRVNFHIRVPNVRVVKDGEQLGVMSTDQARRLARDANLDLVEVVPNARPPVCHILDYDKYRYEKELKEKEQRRRQKEAQTEQKEVRLRPGIHVNDVQTKIAAIRRFLSEGKKVQVNLFFKNREITHKEEGWRVVNDIIAALQEEATVETAPKMEGFKLTCRLQPKKD